MKTEAISECSQEIERKFLVRSVPDGLERYPRDQIEQGYLVIGDDGSEVRLRHKADKYFVTHKHGEGLTRQERETELNRHQFESLWPATEGTRVVKTRYEVPHGDYVIELDVYEGDLHGLVTAEAEFTSEDEAAQFVVPAWIAEEVTHDPRYRNRSLSTQGIPDRALISQTIDCGDDPQRFGKWIEGVSADDSVSEVIRISVHARLAAVEYYLPLAAERAHEDIRYVHELRVATRRSMAAIRIFGDLLPKQHARWFERKLRRIRQAAGKARDLDVLEQRHLRSADQKRSRALLQDIRERRQKAQVPIQRIWKRLLQKDSLARRLHKLQESVAKSGHKQYDDRFEGWARGRMENASGEFFAGMPDDVSDLKELHQFRIRGKQMRYAMELLAPAFPKSFRTELYPVVENLQELLGDVNDHRNACLRLQRWKKAESTKKRTAYLRKLLKAERMELKNSLQRFQAWWTPARALELRTSLQQNCADS